MKKYIIASAVALGLGLSACDEYLDINTDPNSPDEVYMTPGVLMPSVEMNLANGYGNFLRTVGGYYAQHYAQTFGTSNYLDYSQFTMSATRSSGTYTQFYQSCLSNLQTIITKAEATDDWGSFLAATVYRAVIFQALIDCYGDTPYTEALDIKNLQPHFDDGKTVYEGIIAELDNALAKADASLPVCTNFLMPEASTAEWIQFANALKLKLYMRMSNVTDVKAKLADLVAEGNFPASDIAYTSCWANESGSFSPFFAEEFSSAWGSTQINVVANLAIIGTMQQKDNDGNVIYEDGRLSAYFSTNSSGNYTGSISGSNFSTSTSYKSAYWCRPKASATMPVVLISVAEIEFFLAEYYARYGSSSDAETHYKAAIEASFNNAERNTTENKCIHGAECKICHPDGENTSGTAADFLKVFPYDNANFKKSIGIAKWIDLAGYNNFEAWCELRRLRFPAFGNYKTNQFYDGRNDESYDVSSYVPGTLYTPYMVFGQVGENKILERFPYAEDASAQNSNTPDFAGYTSPIFWAK